MSGAGEAIIHPADTADDVAAKIEEREASSEPERVPCPDCGRLYTVRGLAAHRRRAHGVTESQAPVEVEPVFDELAGQAVTLLLVSLATAAKRKLLKDPSAEWQAPEDWIGRVSDLHRRLLDKWLGPSLAEYSLEVAVVLAWAPVLYVNLVAPAVAADTGSTGGRKVDGGGGGNRD